ncbi:hypothetical protein BGW36DRAFT_362925 [Talaromyces proteolyticus]|uniref:Uncharacterized protein n=1 Tax=Talaromyces proteolyticus TaxID=1131652 RepID=A0AAD4KLC7_9EURO|nr:uncharacterized protein BGW36DRAFT_362925 [Talaromyces proteolyticus]KAH8691896.1 hypothetical protein BGW36DRAFT_362925 [Talaromyces proteolyticus]
MDSPDQGSNSSTSEKTRYFRGCAKVKFPHLLCEDRIPGTRALEEKNVRRLVELFQIEGCQAVEPEHRIAAKIRDDDLTKVLSKNDITQEDLLKSLEPPLLEFDPEVHLLCAQGKHRLEAAKKCGLDSWVVELYVECIPNPLWTCMREDSSNEIRFSEGDIYRALRQYQLLGNSKEAQKWLWRLGSDEKRKNVRRIQKKPALCRGLDQLLPYIGLWNDLLTTHFKSVLELRCPQQATHYLNEIYRVWSSLFPPTKGVLVDAWSVKCLNGLMPMYSQSDRDQIQRLMQSKDFFPLVAEHDARDTLFKRLMETPGRFISLCTMVQDINYLMPCTRAFRRLLPEKFEGAIPDAMFQMLDKPTPKLQLSERSFETFTGVETVRELALIQLWLHTMRHFTRPCSKRKAGWKDTQLVPEAHKLQQFAKLAKELGFESDIINGLYGTNPHVLHPTQMVLSFYDDMLYKADPKRAMIVGKEWDKLMTHVISKAHESPQKLSLFSTQDTKLAGTRRFNSPTAEEFETYRSSLFIQYIYSPDQPAAQFPTPLAVARETVFAFFGKAPFVDVVSSLISGHEQSFNTSTSITLPPDIDKTAHEPSPEHAIVEIADTQFQSHETRISHNEATLPMDSSEDATVAPGFEDRMSCGPMEKKIPVTLHRGAADILRIWEQSPKPSLVVFFFFETREYMKFAGAGSFALRSTLQGLLRHYFTLGFYQNEIKLMEDPYEDALKYQLILMVKKDGLGATKDIYEYVSNHVVATGKRSRSPGSERGQEISGDDLIT